MNHKCDRNARNQRVVASRRVRGRGSRTVVVLKRLFPTCGGLERDRTKYHAVRMSKLVVETRLDDGKFSGKSGKVVKWSWSWWFSCRRRVQEGIYPNI